MFPLKSPCDNEFIFSYLKDVYLSHFSQKLKDRIQKQSNNYGTTACTPRSGSHKALKYRVLTITTCVSGSTAFTIFLILPFVVVFTQLKKS